MSIMENGNGTRCEMREFWEDHSHEATVEEMMLDSSADQIEQMEREEILGMVDDVTGMDVLELGAGIGRYTSQFATKAKSVLAVDFMETFVKENEARNGHLANVKVTQADVTQLKMDEESVDFIFSNWLMMYLSDKEVLDLFSKMLKWLRPGGKLYFRESCFHQSGDRARKTNPTQYRDPATYTNYFNAPSIEAEATKGYYAFELIFSKSVQTYIKMKGNPNQVCWYLQKVKLTDADAHGFKTFQEFLDKQQYSRNGILRYERIFGRHFISTGGLETTQEFVKMLNLEAGNKVLDVGAGIGGSAFLMAEKYGAEVTGIDLSSNMIGIAMERANEIGDKRVQFEVADATKIDYPENSFDVVYSRDTILHIKDKEALFSSFLKWLKPGGRLLISDYCCSDEEQSPAFKTYVAQRGYILLSPKQYGQVLEDVGFVKVKAEDRTNQFVDVLKKELVKFEPMEADFVKEFSQADYDAIVNGWNDKLHRCGLGDQRWGLFYAQKGN